jgi:hypothetical protein
VIFFISYYKKKVVDDGNGLSQKIIYQKDFESFLVPSFATSKSPISLKNSRVQRTIIIFFVHINMDQDQSMDCDVDDSCKGGDQETMAIAMTRNNADKDDKAHKEENSGESTNASEKVGWFGCTFFEAAKKRDEYGRLDHDLIFVFHYGIPMPIFLCPWAMDGIHFGGNCDSIFELPMPTFDYVDVYPMIQERIELTLFENIYSSMTIQLHAKNDNSEAELYRRQMVSFLACLEDVFLGLLKEQQSTEPTIEIKKDLSLK